MTVGGGGSVVAGGAGWMWMVEGGSGLAKLLLCRAIYELRLLTATAGDLCRRRRRRRPSLRAVTSAVLNLSAENGFSGVDNNII